MERGLNRILIPFPLKLLVSLKIRGGVLQHFLRELGEVDGFIVEVEVRGVEGILALEETFFVLFKESEGLLTALVIG